MCNAVRVDIGDSHHSKCYCDEDQARSHGKTSVCDNLHYYDAHDD
jgi:hypothetical protein